MGILSNLVLLIYLFFFSYVVDQDNKITVFLAGDSTMANKPYQPGNPEKGWGQVFPLYLKEGVTVENRAINGRSTKSFRDEGHWEKLIHQVKPGDFVIIQFGHNDQKTDSPERYAAADGEYRENLIQFLIPILIPLMGRLLNQ